jgi:DinB superfamily
MSPRLASREIRTQIKAQDGENLVKEKLLREHLMSLLSGRGAHLDAKASFAGIPPKLRGVRPSGMPHSLWELLEHMRIAQWDILEFSRDSKHVSPDWPTGYWPESPEPPITKAWEKSLKLLARDLTAMRKLVANPKTDLFARIPHGTGQTILREAFLVADHNAYHLGQVVFVRRLLGAWKAD